MTEWAEAFTCVGCVWAVAWCLARILTGPCEIKIEWDDKREDQDKTTRRP